MKLTNEEGIGLSMAAFLANDDYDYDPRPNSVSATGVIKPIRQTILSQRAVSGMTTRDISSLTSSTFGSAIHDGIEGVWVSGRYKHAMLKMGYPEAMIDRIVVNPGYIRNIITGKWEKNPHAPVPPPDAIKVFVEIRTEKELDGWIISGKLDFCGDGNLEDHKTTGTYAYQKDPKPEKFRQQGSIYRWLNPDMITSDRMLINYTFTDWAKMRAIIEKKKGYPPKRMMSVPITLMTIPETEAFLRARLAQLKVHMKSDQSRLPLCTREELWQDPTTYKYYKNPASKTRSTKNYDTFAEAQQRLIKDGSVGEVDIVPSEAKFCHYCGGLSVCDQAKQMIADGVLKLEE